MKKILVTLLLAVSLFTVTAQENYTVIVSCDGLRWDYLETFDVPFMDKMADQGVKAVMMPSFPSKTFPNHYTLATGLYPDHHGIIANTFWDRENQVQYSMGDRKISGNPDYYGELIRIFFYDVINLYSEKEIQFYNPINGILK